MSVVCVNTPEAAALLLARALYNRADNDLNFFSPLLDSDVYDDLCLEESRRWSAYESAWRVYRRKY